MSSCSVFIRTPHHYLSRASTPVLTMACTNPKVPNSYRRPTVSLTIP